MKFNSNRSCKKQKKMIKRKVNGPSALKIRALVGGCRPWTLMNFSINCQKKSKVTLMITRPRSNYWRSERRKRRRKKN